MATEQIALPIGQQVSLPGHFDVPVVLEAARPLGKGFECRVRLPDGTLDEAVLSAEEAAALAGASPDADAKVPLANADQLRLLVESARIRLAYTHDRHFAVSMSGIRTLPHQIEAVYLKMLPQPRLRFLLADDPGAGKTIMAGLLIKELKLREAIERVLILCPSPPTIQWQDEMLRWFGESFDMIFSAVDQQQLTNPWQRSNQVIASIDYAKQDAVRERVWQQRWDLVIIDEAHKCSAYTKSSSGRGDEVAKTKRYQLAEHLTAQPAGHVVLLTATPHHGDDDRFAHFIRLLDPDLFPEPHRVGAKAGEIRRDILRLGPDCPWALRRLKEDLRDMEGRRLFPDRHAHTIAFRLNRDEYDLYKAVTGYINEFLPQASGSKKQSVALIRTVLQRRLASSTLAIFESIRRRLEKQQALLKELEDLPPAQRARRFAQLQGRLAGLDRLAIARHGPVRHIATAVVVPASDAPRTAIADFLDDLDPELNRASELAAENVVIAYETARGWETERVGHLKIGFDVRSLGSADAQTGYRDPVHGIRRIEVKGRGRGKHIRLTINEWYKAVQLGDTYWLYVVWNPLDKPDAEPLRIQNPAKHLDHAKKEIVAARFFDIPATAIERAAIKGMA